MATGKVAASSKLKLSGIFLWADAFATTYSAKAPASWLTRFLRIVWSTIMWANSNYLHTYEP
jgi:hypothetical protein